jgi:flagellar motility protein MotE (MotC chaperone)
MCANYKNKRNQKLATERRQLEAMTKEMASKDERIAALEEALKLHTQDLLGDQGESLKTGSEFLAEIARLRGKEKASVMLSKSMKEEVVALSSEVGHDETSLSLIRKYIHIHSQPPLPL